MTPADVASIVAFSVVSALLIVTAWYLGRPDKGNGDGRPPDDED